MAGNTYYVDSSVLVSGDGLSQGSALKTIQEAVATASAGDTIEVAAGAYAGNVVITKSLILHGAGSATTTITGIQGGSDLGTIRIVAGVNDVTIDGFKIIGIDGPTQAIEAGAIYLQGAHSNVTIINNNVVANGDSGLTSEFNASLTNILIDHNEFSGQTFAGPAPGGNGFANQFGENGETNVPRQLVVLGTNNGPGLDSPATNITFTNNLISGTAGGTSTTQNGLPTAPHAQGNTLVTIDASDSVVSDNVFTGFTNRFASQLRVREENTSVQNNDFSSPGGGNIGAEIITDNEPGVISGNHVTFGPGDDLIFAAAGNDDIDGGGGIDTYDMSGAGSGGGFVDLASGLSFSANTGLDTLHNVENAKGSAGADGLYGNDDDNVFIATAGADVIDGRGGSDTFDASSAGTAVNANLDTGAVSGAFTASLTSIENVKTGAGNDDITLSSEANAVDGGAGVDTAHVDAAYSEGAVGYAGGGIFTHAGGDTLKNVEKLVFTDKTAWLVHDAAELTAALAGAADGDVIKLASGTYVGNFTISDAVTIESATGVASDVILSGNFRSLNSLAANDSVADFLKTAVGPAPTGNGLTISHDGVTLKNITITEYSVGIALGTNSGLTITNVDFDSNLDAIRKNTASDVSNFNWTGGTVSNGQFGMNIYAHASGAGAFDAVVIDGVKFSNLNEKGLYFEQLSNAEIMNIEMDNVGQWGRVSDGKFGTGIDINLKFEAYANIDIHDFEFHNVGSSLFGDATADPTGAAIAVKARADNAPPATLTGVEIHDGSIDGTSTGIRFGEPGKANPGPDGVTVSDVEITNALLGSYDNQSTHARTINLSDDADTVTTSPGSVGPIAYVGGDGDDDIAGSDAAETFEGGAGNDTIDGGGGEDTVAYGGNYSDAEFGFAGGKFTIKTSPTDTDAVSNVEQAIFANGTPANMADDTRVWLVDSNAELTAALAGAGDGDIIKLASGNYSGNFSISGKANVTIESASGDPADVTFTGLFRTENPGSIGSTVGDYVAQNPYSGSAAAGIAGFTIAGNDITLRNVTFKEYINAVQLENSTGVTIENVVFDNNVRGVYKLNGAATVTDFTLKGGVIKDGYHGVIVNAAATGGFDGAHIDGTLFEHLAQKGIYAEQMSNSIIENITMNDVGEYGRGPSFAVGQPTGVDGSGIELNLKYQDFEDITIRNFTLTDVGSSDKDGAASPHFNGAAIAIKARSDANSYNLDPATVDGVTIENGTINGTSTGIRVGEPGKPGAAENVTVSDVKIDNALVAEYDNRTGNTLQVNLDGDGLNDDNVVSSNPDATGVIAYTDISDNDTTYTVNEGDTVTETSALGTDTVNARGSFTLGANVENLNLLDAGSGQEDLEDFDLGAVGPAENGWKVIGVSHPEIVIDPDDAGNQVLKISSNPHDGSFGGPYTPDIGVTAGEPGTSADGDVHIIKFRVKPVDAAGDNSRVEVDFGQVGGDDRNNFMAIESLDGGAGVRVVVNHPLDTANWLSNDFSFGAGNVAITTGLSPADWLNFELHLRYVAGGADEIDIYLDGELIGTSTTFENLRPGTAEAHQTSRILIRAAAGSGTQAPQGDANQNKGFFFDDLSSTVTTDSTGIGNELANVINGNSGNNVLNGLGGNDTIDGGDGDDTIDGGSGVDQINGGRGNDLIKLQAGETDVIDGGDGTDTVEITGTVADDTISVVYNGTALTSLGGNVTNVEAVALDLDDDIGSGLDTLSYAGSTQGVTVNLETNTASGFASIAGVENVVGGSGNDSLMGNSDDNVLTGGDGSDEINGGKGGNDTAVFSGNFAEYTITEVALGFSVARGSDVDYVVNIDNFQFDDRTVSVGSGGLETADPTFAVIPALAVNENVAIGTTVHSVGATDANTSEGDVLSYSLEATGGGAYAGPFTIDTNGDIKVSSAIDFEAAASHSFVVKVVDLSGHTKTQTVIVGVNDLNDSPTVITTTAPTSVNENVTGVIYDVNATDADSAATFGNIAYSLSGTDAGSFNIDSDGKITFVTAPNFEAKTNYAFTISAKQGAGTAVTQNVNLTINDLNDNAPVFSSGSTASVNEGTQAATVVYDANATDADSAATFGAIVYSLSGADANDLTIDSDTGEVRLKAVSDFETKATYAFNVVATQGTSSTSKAVVLSVTNINEGVSGLGSKTVDVEKGTTKAPLGELTDVGTTFDVLSLNKGGGHIFNGSTELAVGQTGLTLAQINSLTFSSKGDGSIQFLAHEGSDSETFSVTLNVTPSVSKTYVGTNGADHIDGARGNDEIVGKKGDDFLVGGSGRDTIRGNGGDDTINGGSGKDVLIGGSGEDKFVFANKLVGSKFDTIVDFQQGVDTIQLDSDIFSALGSKVTRKEFHANNSGNAHDATDRIIYEKDTGKLYYDADGNGAGAKVHFATLDSNISNLSHLDFEIV